MPKKPNNKNQLEEIKRRLWYIYSGLLSAIFFLKKKLLKINKEKLNTPANNNKKKIVFNIKIYNVN